jgi:hypothetical protein
MAGSGCHRCRDRRLQTIDALLCFTTHCAGSQEWITTSRHRLGLWRSFLVADAGLRMVQIRVRSAHKYSHKPRPYFGRVGCRSPLWPRARFRGVRRAWEPGSGRVRAGSPPGDVPRPGRRQGCVGDGCGGHVRRDSSTGLIRPTSLPSGSATIAYRAPQNASNGGCRPW